MKKDNISLLGKSGLAGFCIWFLIGFPPAGVSQTVSKPTRSKQSASGDFSASRQRILFDEGWRFFKYPAAPDQLIYDQRPEVKDKNDSKVADSRPTDAVKVESAINVLKPWILPTANPFVRHGANHHQRPSGASPGGDFPFVKDSFDDAGWETVNLPHDWAAKGPFYPGEDVPVGGGMGRLPIQGVAWYRHKLELTKADENKNIYLDVDGAMSYAMVWVNGQLAGGWPYGYNSFRIDLTPYLHMGSGNQIAIRIDNPANSSRWYPGAGLYRHVWITKTNPVHVAHWGSFISTKKITKAAATIDIAIDIENNSPDDRRLQLVTTIFAPGPSAARPVVVTPSININLRAGQISNSLQSVQIPQPKLWGPYPSQQPQLYTAITRLFDGDRLIDTYKTHFGIREVQFDPDKGILVNGHPLRMQGVNQHHDLGALGSAFNLRAATRQLEILRELGCNAIRFSHNPPAPELLDLTDQMGILVIDEIFDCWEQKKTPLDFHLIFPDWYEADIRSFIRRDRNHPSVIAWSFGNEVGEQYTGEAGAALAQKLHAIIAEEDSSRPATISMNYAKPDMPLPAVADIINLNYQGEGIRDAPAYLHLNGIRTTPLYPAFRKKFPEKLILSSETASALSTRGSYLFPVAAETSAPVSDGKGGDPVNRLVSAYELYTAAFGASPDKVFASQDRHPYVAGEFVWSGWDYLGEPTPYYSARSSYSGIIDLAGFKKDRFYLYQSRWRPDFPMVHILPHWNWPERIGQITPVHVFTSGDEAELFLNGRSLGRKKKAAFEYRLRWDDVVYAPGELKVVAYRNGKPWSSEMIHTTGPAFRLVLEADRRRIRSDGNDLSFITATIRDEKGRVVPIADNLVSFSVTGPGKLLATDNGDPADLVAFPSPQRKAFFGYVLAIIQSEKGKQAGSIQVKASSPGLESAGITINLQH